MLLPYYNTKQMVYEPSHSWPLVCRYMPLYFVVCRVDFDLLDKDLNYFQVGRKLSIGT